MVEVMPVLEACTYSLLLTLIIILTVNHVIKGRSKRNDKLPLIVTPKVTAIKFYVYEDLSTDVPKCHTFKLGLGSCGKVATSLTVSDPYDGTHLRIVQVTEDGERKVFTYRYSQIAGRLDITYDH
ncbi:hypothetical protein phiPccP1_00008 [Pectobacterium phage phiPccP-1]|nr:hypothetical protein phiPccP1_00008 [Pectobacterium phage phiPccP-1]